MPDRHLKPCPFCGRSDTLVIGSFQVGLQTQYTGVRCVIDRGGCGASGGTGYADDWQRVATEADAVRAWNRRTDHA